MCVTNPARIVVFGSSSVQGRGDPEGGGFVGRLRHWHEALAEENVTFNLGLAGDSSTKMLARFALEVPVRKPELIILYPGLNDIRRSSHTAPTALGANEFAANIRALVTSSMSIAPTIFVSAFPIDETRTTPWKGSNYVYLSSDAANFSEIGRQQSEASGAHYLPVFEHWSKDGAAAANLSFDGLHGTPEAHKRLADKLKEIIRGQICWE